MAQPDHRILIGKGNATISRSRSGQSPRPDRRSDGNRQDRLGPGAGRRLLGARRAGVHGRREGRHVGHLSARTPNPKLDERRAPSVSPATSSGFSDGVLGPVRRAGPSCAGHRLGDGSGAAGAAARPERDPGRRAGRGLRGRRRPGPAVARPQGSAGAHELRGRARDELDPIRPGQHVVGRGDPAQAPDARAAGRRPLLRRAGPRHPGADAHRPVRPGDHQRARRRPADVGAEIVRDVPVVAALGAVRGAARGRRSAPAQARVLLRRGASPVRGAPKALWTRSSRWCA